MLTQIMHTMSSALQYPVIIVLIALVVVVVVIVGMVVAEVFTERKNFTLSLPAFIDELQGDEDPAQVVRRSGMLWRQKKGLLEILSHPEATPSERESLAVNVVADEQAIYDNRVKVTDLIAKIGPMFGLMGTLIPLGPGVIAIGQGETDVLSQSLLIAFDTTVLGLIAAAVALIISTIRKTWYAKYMSEFEAATECVLEKANSIDYAQVARRRAMSGAASRTRTPSAPRPNVAEAYRVPRPQPSPSDLTAPLQGVAPQPQSQPSTRATAPASADAGNPHYTYTPQQTEVIDPVPPADKRRGGRRGQAPQGDGKRD